MFSEYSVFSFSHSEVDILLQTQCLSLKLPTYTHILLLLKYYFAFPEQVFFLHGCIIKKLI